MPQKRIRNKSTVFKSLSYQKGKWICINRVWKITFHKSLVNAMNYGKHNAFAVTNQNDQKKVLETVIAEENRVRKFYDKISI